MHLRAILKLRSFEITENVYFFINFSAFGVSRRATKLQEKGNLARVLKKCGKGHVPPVSPPTVPTSIAGSKRLCSQKIFDHTFTC